MDTCKSRKAGAAVAACSRLIESGKYKGRFLYLHLLDRGGAYQASGAHDRAIEDFRKAIELDPTLPYAFINRGVSWAKLGEYDRAIEDFTQALRIDPKNANAYNNRGGAYRDKRDFDQAMPDFKRAIYFDRKLTDAFFNRGLLYAQMKDYTQAIADYTVVIRESPRDIVALAARGLAWSNKDDYKRAKADYEAVLAAPGEDKNSNDIKDAVRELLRALLEEKAGPETKCAAPGVEEKKPFGRIALVIGNSAYDKAVAPPSRTHATTPKMLPSAWMRLDSRFGCASISGTPR